MSIKVYLATALKDLDHCRKNEHKLDLVQERIAKNSNSRKDLVQLKRDYSILFDKKIHAIELLNYVRNNANANNELKMYCEDLMKAEMDNAERLRDKEANILLPVELIGDVSKEGFVKSGAKGMLFQHDGMKKPILKDKPLVESIPVKKGGCYLVTVRNHDDYTAGPTVEVTIGCNPQQRTMRRVLPNMCGWARFIGVVKPSSIHVAVSSDGFLRASHVSVDVEELIEVGNEWSELPTVSTARLESLMGTNGGRDCDDDDDGEMEFDASKFEEPVIPGVTPTTVDSRLPFDQREGAARQIVSTWPVNNVTACPLNYNEQRLLQAISNLPIPTPLS